MKKTCIAVSVVTFLSACSSNSGPVAQGNFQNEYRQQERVMAQAVDMAPKWMSTLPKESGIIYENGTAISSDFSMADLKAKTMAYVKICTGAGGKVRSQMKMYRADNDGASIEQSELTVRSLCPDVDISGVETVEMKHVAEGNRIRTYVLVALPMGSKNLIKSTREIENRSTNAFKELDGVTAPKSSGSEQINPIPEQGNIGSPDASSASVDVTPVRNPDVSTRGIALMPVDNAEYKMRRDAALQKPGAVIGQTSINN